MIKIVEAVVGLFLGANRANPDWESISPKRGVGRGAPHWAEGRLPAAQLAG
jgi:hypothetical protein